ncbi:Crp/Fnr family transcriptional regulator [Myxococcota bacterium]|nr:Crp/Fnr family transcriptional regulator [Myxococcota bacterium]
MSLDDAFTRVRFLAALGPDERERLRPHAKLRSLDTGDPCWSEGQPADEFTFAVRGRVKLVKTAETGRHTIVDMMAAGELLAGPAVLCHTPHPATAVAMEDGTQIVGLPRREVMDVLERSPSAARAFMYELALHGLSLVERIEEVGGGQVERRIALLLLRLADRSGVQARGQAIRIPIALSRQDLADLCGTTVETAIRVMSSLKRRGIVETVARGFVVHDRRALEALV